MYGYSTRAMTARKRTIDDLGDYPSGDHGKGTKLLSAQVEWIISLLAKRVTRWDVMHTAVRCSCRFFLSFLSTSKMGLRKLWTQQMKMSSLRWQFSFNSLIMRTLNLLDLLSRATTAAVALTWTAQMMAIAMSQVEKELSMWKKSSTV